MQRIFDILRQVKRDLDMEGADYSNHDLYQKARERIGVNTSPILIPSVRDRFQEAECPTCHDIGRVMPNLPLEHPNFGKSVPCPDCYRATGGKDPVSYKLEKSEFGPVAKGKEFSNFKLLSGTKEAYEAARQFGEGDCSDFYLLILFGRNGCGKTHLAAAAGRNLIRQGAVPRFTRSDDMVLSLKSAMQRQELEQHANMWKRCDVLVLDDWGMEDATDWARATIESILIGRFEEYRPTLITSNINPRAIADKETGYPRLYSRFSESGRAKMIVINAADYRQKGKASEQ